MLGQYSAKSNTLSPDAILLFVTCQDGFLTEEVKAENKKKVQLDTLNIKNDGNLKDTNE